MKALRAKFVKSTNLEIDKCIPKDVYANISFAINGASQINFKSLG